MYILSHIENGKYAVADTDDRVIELLSKEQFESYKLSGVDIETWEGAKSWVTYTMLRTSAYKVYNQIKRSLTGADLLEYLQTHIIYRLSHIYNQFSVSPDWSRGIKVLDYGDTQGFFIVVIWLSNNQRAILKVTENNESFTQLVPYTCDYKNYSAGSGYMYNIVLKRNGLEIANLDESTIYTMLYSDDFSKLYFIDISSLGNDRYNACYINNPSRQPLR